jgi:hypothetical protein
MLKEINSGGDNLQGKSHQQGKQNSKIQVQI